MTSTSRIPRLDHLIHLVPDLDESIALYSNLGFVVLRGGKHADGLTENALIVLPDGVYIELISFVSANGENDGDDSALRQRQSKHWWYGRRNGWIDWCLLGIPERDITDGVYVDPQQGGRKTTSGDVIEWKVTFPLAKYPRGTIPFWCTDLTPRDKRVPPISASSPHPNRTKGITALRLLFRPDSMQETFAHYAAILRNTPHPPQFAQDVDSYKFQIATPNGDAGTLPLILKRAQDPEELHWIEEYGEGLYEVDVGGECSPNLKARNSIVALHYSHPLHASPAAALSRRGSAAEKRTARWNRAHDVGKGIRQSALYGWQVRHGVARCWL